MKRKIATAAVIVIVITIISLLMVSCVRNMSNDISASDTSEQSSNTVINSSMMEDYSEGSSYATFENEDEDNSKATNDVSSSSSKADSKQQTSSKTSSSTSSKVTASTSKVSATATPTPAPTTKPTATATPQPTKTPVPSNICPICDSKLNSDGSCNTFHGYTGYGIEIYDEATKTVYVVCNSCGQRWPRGTFSDPWAFSKEHGIACYNQANMPVMECGYCGKEWKETDWDKMYKGQYCNRECAMATGYYCPNCEAGLYVDGCHNCGYKEICSECGKESSGECLKQFCSICNSHAGHGTEKHCPTCQSLDHTTHPVCGAVGHSADGTCSVCGSTYTTPKCGAIGHTESGNCPVCGATKALDNNENMGDTHNPGDNGAGDNPSVEDPFEE